MKLFDELIASYHGNKDEAVLLISKEVLEQYKQWLVQNYKYKGFTFEDEKLTYHGFKIRVA